MDFVLFFFFVFFNYCLYVRLGYFFFFFCVVCMYDFFLFVCLLVLRRKHGEREKR